MDTSRTPQLIARLALSCGLLYVTACGSKTANEPVAAIDTKPAPAATAAPTPAPAPAPPAAAPATQPAAKAAAPATESRPSNTASIPASPKIFIEPEKGGFDSYISAGIVRKKTPVVVTKNRAEADYVLTSVVTQEREDTGGKVARCLVADCVGIDGNQTASVQLADPSGKVVWAYNVRKNGSESFQSSAEAIAKHLKEFLEPKPPKKPKKS